jgi:hypothetical protein
MSTEREVQAGWRPEQHIDVVAGACGLLFDNFKDILVKFRRRCPQQQRLAIMLHVRPLTKRLDKPTCENLVDKLFTPERSASLWNTKSGHPKPSKGLETTGQVTRYINRTYRGLATFAELKLGAALRVR